jgi:hypothetical protein
MYAPARSESLRAVYLDDKRTPLDRADFSWIILRTFAEFTHYILRYGLPDFLSFDHDLGELPDGELAPTGFDAAKWLVEYCLDNDLRMPGFAVHSSNPSGGDNIVALLNNLRVFQGQTATGYRTTW